MQSEIQLLERPASADTERIVRAAARGDQRAWDQLVVRYTSLLWTVARAHRLGPADATDVVQTTWLRLVEHLPTLAKPGGVGAWLATNRPPRVPRNRSARGALGGLR